MVESTITIESALVVNACNIAIQCLQEGDATDKINLLKEFAIFSIKYGNCTVNVSHSDLQRIKHYF